MARPVHLEGTSLPTPGPVDSFDMKTVFLAPGLKNELLPARLIPKQDNTRPERRRGRQSTLASSLVLSMRLAGQKGVRSWMTPHPVVTLSNSAFGIESRFRQEV